MRRSFSARRRSFSAMRLCSSSFSRRREASGDGGEALTALLMAAMEWVPLAVAFFYLCTRDNNVINSVTREMNL